MISYHKALLCNGRQGEFIGLKERIPPQIDLKQ